MTITVIGRISVPNVICEKCGSTIPLYNYAPPVKCGICGAMYQVSKSEVKENAMEITLDFVEFQCLYGMYSNQCHNVCPAQEMFCKEHTSDTAFDEAHKNIKYCEDVLAAAQEKLRKMKESKKTWLIEEVSGLNEKDPVSKN